MTTQEVVLVFQDITGIVIIFDLIKGLSLIYYNQNVYYNRSLCRSPEGKTDWRQYPRDVRGMIPPGMPPRPLFYGGNYPGGAPPMYPQEGRFPSGEWRPPEREYYRNRPQ